MGKHPGAKWFESTTVNYPVSQGDAGCFIHRLGKELTLLDDPHEVADRVGSLPARWLTPDCSRNDSARLAPDRHEGQSGVVYKPAIDRVQQRGDQWHPRIDRRSYFQRSAACWC
jgi:hypothetical protein